MFHTLKYLHRKKSLVGILLILATIIALILENSPMRNMYHHLIDYQIGALNLPIAFTIHEFINEGLLAIFFFLIGLEVKYEIVAGSLKTWDKLLHPAAAAVGGVVFPALIYLLINMDNKDFQAGWAIPSATDIAFAVGVLSLVSDIPAIIKTLLVTIAIFDDLLAILIIALFYSEPIITNPLYIAAAALAAMRILVYRGVSNLWAYVVPAILIWLGVLYSGVHATISGFIIAISLPTVQSKNNGYNTKRTYQTLEPWVNYGILPLFALANAGVYLLDIDNADLINPVSRGIMLGLLLGKPIGIGVTSLLYCRISKTTMPDVTLLTFLGMSFLCGIGFTMSLFIGGLAFANSSPDLLKWVKIGVLRGSFLSAIAGLTLLSLGTSSNKEIRRHQHDH